MPPQDQKLVTDAVAASVAVVAVAAALGPKACHQKGGAFSSLVEQCRELRDDVPYEVQDLVEPVCDTLADGHWALTGIVAANVACYLPALANQEQWCVSKHELSHERLLRYQLAHVNATHIMGNMLTLMVVVLSVTLLMMSSKGLSAPSSNVKHHASCTVVVLNVRFLVPRCVS